jgi:hypothetical protein
MVFFRAREVIYALTFFMMLYGVVLKIYVKNLNTLCPETSMDDESTEWIEKQDDKSG